MLHSATKSTGERETTAYLVHFMTVLCRPLRFGTLLMVALPLKLSMLTTPTVERPKIEMAVEALSTSMIWLWHDAVGTQS